MMKRTISWIAAVMLLVSMVVGGSAVPAAATGETPEDAKIGWITDFTNLTKWKSCKLDGQQASDLSQSGSTVQVLEGSVTSDGFGATLYASASYANDYYFAYQEVTIDLDQYPYLYTQYTPMQGNDNAFQLGAALKKENVGIWTQLSTGDSMKNLCSATSGVEIEGNYRRLDLKTALGVTGTQTIYVFMGFCYVNGSTWEMNYTFLGTDGNLESDAAVAAYAAENSGGTETPGGDLTAEYTESNIVLDGVISSEEWGEAVYSIDKDSPNTSISSGVEEKNYPSSVTQYMRWNETYLYVAVEVEDADHSNPNTGIDTWRGDSIFIGIKPKNAESGNFNRLVTALADDGNIYVTDVSHRNGSQEEGRSGLSSCHTAKVVRKDGKTVYEIRIEWAKLLHPVVPQTGISFTCWTDVYCFGTDTSSEALGTFKYCVKGEDGKFKNPIVSLNGGNVVEPEDTAWSMDLSTQAADWIYHGDYGKATHSASMEEVLAGATCPLKFTVGEDNGYGGKSLTAEFDYSVPGAVFYQFLGIRLTVDVDKTPYLYFKGDFSKVDFFNIYLNDNEISGEGNGVMGDQTNHDAQCLDLKEHYKSGVHTFYLIAFFYDGDGEDGKPFTIEYCFTGTAEDAPKDDPDDDPSSNPSSNPSSTPSGSEPENPTLTDEETGIEVSGEDIEEGMALRVNPIVDGDDYSFVQQCVQGKLSAWKAFDIAITNFGIVVTPDSQVTVKMPVPTDCKGKNIVVYRLADNGELTKMTVTNGQDAVTFTAGELGLYVIGTDGGAAPEPAPETGAAAPVAATALLLVSAGAMVVCGRKKHSI